MVKQLQQKGVNTSVLVIHQGGFQQGTATPKRLRAATWPAATSLEIASRLDPSIKVIVSAHTHAEYRCTITTPDGVTRLITSASSFGRILSDITLTIDDKSGELVAASAENSIVRNSSNPRNAVADVPLLDLPEGRAGRPGGAAVRDRVGAPRQQGDRQGHAQTSSTSRTRWARSHPAT